MLSTQLYHGSFFVYVKDRFSHMLCYETEVELILVSNCSRLFFIFDKVLYSIGYVYNTLIVSQ